MTFFLITTQSLQQEFRTNRNYWTPAFEEVTEWELLEGPLNKYQQQKGMLISPADLAGCRKIIVSDHQEAMEMAKGL
jgi:hypothetical protein